LLFGLGGAAKHRGLAERTLAAYMAFEGRPDRARARRIDADALCWTNSVASVFVKALIRALRGE
jgi:hypothetical protein